MARSTKESWLDGDGDLKTDTVEDVPVPGESLLVRGLPAAYSNEATGDAVEMKQLPNGDQISTVNTRTLEILKFTHGVINDDGTQMFTVEEATQISEKYGPAWAKVLTRINELSGTDQESLDETRARFPGVGGSKNGVHLEGGSPAGSPGSDVPVRPGAEDGDVD